MIDPAYLENEVYPSYEAAGETDLPPVAELLDATVMADAHAADVKITAVDPLGPRVPQDGPADGAQLRRRAHRDRRRPRRLGRGEHELGPHATRPCSSPRSATSAPRRCSAPTPPTCAVGCASST